jgi:hypothetical protein
MSNQKDISKNVVSAAEFEQLLQISFAQKGVCVLDVYSSEWGPCKAISETFRRLYTEAGDAVHLRFFTIECNAVLESLRTEDPSIARHQRPKNTEAIKETLPEFWAPILERRRGKAKPFFVMYKEGRKVYEVDGVNTPLLRAYVKDLCTVKTPASEFIQQQKLLEFWEEHFNPDESEVSLDKFMRVITVVCRLAVSLTEEEKAVFFEAIGIRKEAKEKIVTAEALQKWIGEDDTRTVPMAFAETLPEYEVRAAQARAEREAEERKRQDQLRKEQEEAERRAAEEKAAAEAARKKAEAEAVALSYKKYTAPTKEQLQAEAGTDAAAVKKIDAECRDLLPLISGPYVPRPQQVDIHAPAWKYIQDTVADSARTTSQRRVKSVPFQALSDASETANTTLDDLVDRAPGSLLEMLLPPATPPTNNKFSVKLHRVACAAYAFAEKLGGADGKASLVKALAVALATASGEDAAKFFNLEAPFADVANLVQTGGVFDEAPTLAATLLGLCAEPTKAGATYYAILKPDNVPDASVELVLPALTMLCSQPPESVPDNRVCIAIKNLPLAVDLSLRNGQHIAASGWWYKGAVSASDTSTGYTTFVVAPAQELLGGEDRREALLKKMKAVRIADDTFLRAFHHYAVLRMLRKEAAVNVKDPFWVKFNERLPFKPADAVRELFNEMDGDRNGGLSVAEVVKGVSKALEIPWGDDITDAVQYAFRSVRAARQGAGKKVSDDANRVIVQELSLCIQYIKMYYELLAMFSHVAGDKTITPDELSAAAAPLKEWGQEIDESTFEAIDTNKNGKIAFAEFAEWAIKHKLDLADDEGGQDGAAAAAASGDHEEL